MICLALELVGPWVVLGFSVGMEAFDELLLINVPWSQEFSVTDHALITWLSCTDHVAEHSLITWLITHCSRN